MTRPAEIERGLWQSPKACCRFRPMSRQPRTIIDNAPYHVLNRSNGRFRIFNTDTCFQRFCRLLSIASEKHRMPILAFCIMPNHWHLIVRPRNSIHLSTFMAWLSNTHTRRYHVANASVGQGPLYQGRFKAILLKDNDQLWTATRYVERNPVNAGLVRSCSGWPWSSISSHGRQLVSLTPSPFQESQSWRLQVDAPMTNSELEKSDGWLE